MNKRLRKKKQKREFTFLGFEVQAQLLPSKDNDRFIDDFIDFIEENNFSFGGSSGNENFVGIVQLGFRKDIDETHKSKVVTWLQNRSDLSNIVTGKLKDINRMEDNQRLKRI